MTELILLSTTVKTIKKKKKKKLQAVQKLQQFQNQVLAGSLVPLSEKFQWTSLIAMGIL